MCSQIPNRKDKRFASPQNTNHKRVEDLRRKLESFKTQIKLTNGEYVIHTFENLFPSNKSGGRGKSSRLPMKLNRDY